MRKIIIFFTSFCCFSKIALCQHNSIILGKVEEIQSKILNEKRVLNIYFPDTYNQKDTIKYPVIYLLDGSVNEDFIHIVGLVQFSSFEWVNQLPKSIVVGITNVDRKKDFTFPSTVEEEKKAFPTSGNSEQFIKFLEQELKPFIKATFRANHRSTIIGESLGGLLATQVLLTKPNLFDKYIIVSPSLWWSDGALLHNALTIIQDSVKQPITVYIGVGKEGLAPSKKDRVMEVDANALADKLEHIQNSFLRISFDYLPYENHATIMHQAVLNAFKKIGRL